MKYNFKKAKKSIRYCGCSVGEKYVYLSRELKDKLVDDRCDLLVDKDNEALSFISNKEGTYKLTKQGKGFIVNCGLSGQLQKGRYLFKEVSGNNIICKK